MKTLTLLGIFLLPCLSSTWAASINATTPNRRHCVDPVRFDTCFTAAADTQASCIKAANGDNSTITDCQQTADEAKLNCFLAYCWNKVYSCEYQYLANQVASAIEQSGGSIPFYPAPDNAPGGCSCNIGKLYHNFTAAVVQGFKTCNQTQTNITDLRACDCCAFSAAFSAFYAYCPSIDPNYLALPDAIDQFHLFERGVPCAGVYNATNCESKFGLSPPADPTPVSADSLPTWTGTGSLTTLTGSLTSPPGGPTMTWSGVDAVFTATAAPYNAANAASTATSAAGPSKEMLISRTLWWLSAIASVFGVLA